MAIWQVPIKLKRKGDMQHGSQNLMEELYKILPQRTSWNASILQFGNLDSTCLEIDSAHESTLLRIDVRTITKVELETISKCIVSNGWRIDGEKEPTFDVIVEMIRQSDACRFVKDGENFLRSINKG